MGVKLGKDVEELNWVEVKSKGFKIKHTPGKGLTFAAQKKKQKNGISHKRPIA